MVLNVTNTSATNSVYNLYQMLRPWQETQATYNQYATGQAEQPLAPSVRTIEARRFLLPHV